MQPLPTAALLKLADIQDLIAEGKHQQALPSLYKLAGAFPDNEEIQSLIRQSFPPVPQPYYPPQYQQPVQNPQLTYTGIPLEVHQGSRKGCLIGLTVVVAIIVASVIVSAFTNNSNVGSVGLGTSGRFVRSSFEGSQNFIFTNGSPVNGQPRVFGKSPNGAAQIELIGNNANLSSINLFFVATTDKSVVEQNLYYSTYLLRLVAPDWNGSEKWYLDSLLSATTNKKDVNTTFGSTDFLVTFKSDLSLVELIIKPR